MEAGRELDAKVAEALGMRVDHASSENPRYCRVVGNAEFWPEVPRFSTTWEGMGVLIEEAKKQEMYLDLLPDHEGYTCEAKSSSNYLVDSATEKEAPYTVALAFLKANGVI
jgi:hypothetical protein